MTMTDRAVSNRSCTVLHCRRWYLSKMPRLIKFLCKASLGWVFNYGWCTIHISLTQAAQWGWRTAPSLHELIWSLSRAHNFSWQKSRAGSLRSECKLNTKSASDCLDHRAVYFSSPSAADVVLCCRVGSYSSNRYKVLAVPVPYNIIRMRLALRPRFSWSPRHLNVVVVLWMELWLPPPSPPPASHPARDIGDDLFLWP